MINRTIVLSHAWLSQAGHQLTERLKARDERGNNSLEMAIIISVVVAVALIVTAFIFNAVNDKIDGIKLP